MELPDVEAVKEREGSIWGDGPSTGTGLEGEKLRQGSHDANGAQLSMMLQYFKQHSVGAIEVPSIAYVLLFIVP